MLHYVWRILIVALIFLLWGCDKPHEPVQAVEQEIQVETKETISGDEEGIAAHIPKPLDDAPTEIETLVAEDSPYNASEQAVSRHPIKAKDWAHANNNIGIKAMRYLKGKGNVAFSPYSVQRAMGMAMEGAKEETLEEMQRALGFTAYASHIGEVGHAIESDVFSSKRSKVVLSSANRIYLDSAFQVEVDYQKRVEDLYGSQAQRLDFRGKPQESVRTINAWVAKETNQQIKELLPPHALHAQSLMVIVNALYFKAPWAHPFQKRHTENRTFTGTQGKKDVKMMRTTHTYRYYEESGIQALIMPYKDIQYASLFILPPKAILLSEFLETMEAEQITLFIEKAKQREVEVYIPRFKVRTNITLDAMLKEWGIRQAWDRHKADFTAIVSDNSLYLERVFHQAVVHMNEDGTEAAASTAIRAVRSAVIANQPRPKVFNANRPFIFMILHIPTHTVLFSGQIENF